MIVFGIINNSFFIDCSKLNNKLLFNFLKKLKLLNTYKITPNFIFNKNRKIIILKGKLRILINLNIQQFYKINTILKILKKLKLNIKYLDNLPLLENKITKDIYFINIIHTFNKDLIYNMFNFSNKYLLYKKYNLNEIRLLKKIYLYVLLYFKSNININKLFIIIQKLNNLNLSIKYIILYPKLNNEKKNKLFELNLDINNSYKFIEILYENLYKSILNIIKNLKLKIKLDLLYIYNASAESEIFNLEISYKFYLNKVILTNNLNNLKIENNVNKSFINLVEFKDKSIYKYDINDIDFNNIYLNNKKVNKAYFIKYKNSLDLIYNFKNKQYPKKINLNNVLITKKALSNLKLNISKKKIINLHLEILLSMESFYNNIKVEPIQNYL